jgi:hypothetical protein
MLGVLVLEAGVFFVEPYYDAINAQLYLGLRKKAVTNGLTINEELHIEK